MNDSSARSRPRDLPRARLVAGAGIAALLTSLTLGVAPSATAAAPHQGITAKHQSANPAAEKTSKTKKGKKKHHKHRTHKPKVNTTTTTTTTVTTTVTNPSTTGSTGTTTTTSSTSGSTPTSPFAPPVLPDMSGLGVIPTAGIRGAGSEWDRDISSAPVAVDSAAQVANLANQVTSRWNGIAAFNYSQYNISFATASPFTPRVDVAYDNCQGRTGSPTAVLYNSQTGPFLDVPIPAAAVPASGSDGELTIWDPFTDQLWELWRANKQSDGWHACWGGRIDHYSTHPGYFAGNQGASASGMSIAGGVIGIQEMAAGAIDHALRLGIPEVANRTQFSWPAQRSDGTMPVGTPNAIMEGRRFRLDPSLNVDALGLTPIATAVAKAAQRYGFIITDKSGAVSVSTESGASVEAATGVNPWTQLMGGVRSSAIMANFPWSSLQAMPVNYGEPTN